ncbi:SipW-dependent-type signal peptide-containing protein [Bogoriella caseilytica]|uniref:Putative ribosomally synthesized peptide with SipW-like signal peptide n=1 Tax=Bogoriella caseilytica TaxID=56055 RepID=A0A3N2BFL1_9MICO|nr:SipW-dependent-type signal peptide-containing protein [Bogoriella caseilytica]ROR73854.1 putative ribosomally synthesized peptide with SipW-like signal peptide [Bogoriella caseilytica]
MTRQTLAAPQGSRPARWALAAISVLVVASAGAATAAAWTDSGEVTGQVRTGNLTVDQDLTELDFGEFEHYVQQSETVRLTNSGSTPVELTVDVARLEETDAQWQLSIVSGGRGFTLDPSDPERELTGLPLRVGTVDDLILAPGEDIDLTIRLRYSDADGAAAGRDFGEFGLTFVGTQADGEHGALDAGWTDSATISGPVRTAGEPQVPFFTEQDLPVTVEPDLSGVYALGDPMDWHIDVTVPQLPTGSEMSDVTRYRVSLTGDWLWPGLGTLVGEHFHSQSSVNPTSYTGSGYLFRPTWDGEFAHDLISRSGGEQGVRLSIVDYGAGWDNTSGDGILSLHAEPHVQYRGEYRILESASATTFWGAVRVAGEGDGCRYEVTLGDSAAPNENGEVIVAGEIDGGEWLIEGLRVLDAIDGPDQYWLVNTSCPSGSTSTPVAIGDLEPASHEQVAADPEHPNTVIVGGDGAPDGAVADQ